MAEPQSGPAVTHNASCADYRPAYRCPGCMHIAILSMEGSQVLLTAAVKRLQAQVAAMEGEIKVYKAARDHALRMWSAAMQATRTAQPLAQAVRRYLFEDGYDPNPTIERHDTGCAVYDPVQSGPCDCGSQALLEALLAHEALARLDAAQQERGACGHAWRRHSAGGICDSRTALGGCHCVMIQQEPATSAEDDSVKQMLRSRRA